MSNNNKGLKGLRLEEDKSAMMYSNSIYIFKKVTDKGYQFVNADNKRLSKKLLYPLKKPSIPDTDICKTFLFTSKEFEQLMNLRYVLNTENVMQNNKNKFKTLMHCGMYVDVNLLNKGIYSASIPYIYSNETTIEFLEANARIMMSMIPQVIYESYFDNLRKCKLVEIEITIC